jgi:vitamin B12 transporter
VRKIFSLGLAALIFFLSAPTGFADEKKSIWQQLSGLFLKNTEDPEVEIPRPVQKSEKVVFASRVSQPITPLEEVPANVTLKGREFFWNKVPATFQEAVQDAEGVILYDQVGNGLDMNFGLRGFPESFAATFLLDGVRINEVDGGAVTLPLILMDDMESIQIDRGSASPIYGSGAFAGVVHLTTQKPSDKLMHLFGGLEFSSFQGVRFNQGVSGSIPDKISPLKGKWTYYFNGGRSGWSEGFRDNNEFHSSHFNIKTGYELPDNQGGIRVGVKHIEAYLANPGELTLAQYHANSKASNKPLDYRRLDNTILQLDADKKFWDERITASIFNSWRLNRLELQTTSGSFTDFLNGYDPNTQRVTQKSRETDLVWQIDYQDSWTSWLSNKSSIGMEYRWSRDQALNLNAFQGVITDDPPDADRIAHYQNTALFWRETLGLWERLFITAGMRHDIHDLTTQDYLNAMNNLSRRWDKSTVTVGTTFKPCSTTDVFWNYSQGFITPSISDINPFGSNATIDLQPTESDSYEVGMRFRHHDWFAFKTSFFLIDMKNEVVFDSSAITADSPFGQNTNLGASRRKGLELRGDMAPFKELYLYTSYARTSARVRETDGDGIPFDNRSLGQVPEHRITFGATLVPLRRLGEPWDGFKISVDGVFTGKQHPTAYESTTEDLLQDTGYWIKSFSVWNFKVSQEWRGWQIYFKVNNIFDQEYFGRAVSATSFGTSIYPFGNYLFVTPGAPREYVWGLRWGF